MTLGQSERRGQTCVRLVRSRTRRFITGWRQRKTTPRRGRAL